MKKRLALKIVRDMWRLRGRTLLAIIAIAIGIIGSGSALNAYSILRQSTEEGYLATHPPSALLRVAPVSDETLEAVLSLDDVLVAELGREFHASVTIRGKARPLILFARKDFNQSSIGHVESERGVWPPGLGEIVLESSSLSLIDAELGDSLSLVIDEETIGSLEFNGVARDSGLAPGWMEHMVYGFVSFETLDRLNLVDVSFKLSILVTGDLLDRDRIRRISEKIRSTLELEGVRVFDVTVPEPGKHVHSSQMDSLFFVQASFGVLTLILSGLLILNFMTSLLSGQVREIGVMKTLGARSFQVASIYIGMLVVIGSAALVIAIPVALVIGNLYARSAGRMLNFDVSGTSPEIWVTLLQAGTGILVPVGAAAIPVWRGCRISVGDALRERGIGEGGPSSSWLQRLVIRFPGKSRPFLISLRNTFRRRSRLALTLITLSLGGALFLGTLNLKESIRRTVDEMFEALNYDVSVWLEDSHSIESLEAAAIEEPSDFRVEAWYGTRGHLVNGETIESDGFSITGLPIDSEFARFPLVSGKWLRGNDPNSIVINKRLLDLNPQLAVGHSVSLLVEGRPAVVTILGVVRSTPVTPVAYFSRETLTGLCGCMGLANRLVARSVKEGSNVSGIAARLNSALKSSGIKVGGTQVMSEARAVFEDHMLMVANLLAVFSLAVLVVGGLGLATTMTLAVLERRREIAVMRVIGASHGVIRRMVVMESLFIGLLGCLVALPLSMPLSAFVSYLFGMIMFKSPNVFVAEPIGFGTWILVMMGVALFASYIPARKATKDSTWEGLVRG